MLAERRVSAYSHSPRISDGWSGRKNSLLGMLRTAGLGLPNLPIVPTQALMSVFHACDNTPSTAISYTNIEPTRQPDNIVQHRG